MVGKTLCRDRRQAGPATSSRHGAPDPPTLAARCWRHPPALSNCQDVDLPVVKTPLFLRLPIGGIHLAVVLVKSQKGLRVYCLTDLPPLFRVSGPIKFFTIAQSRRSLANSSLGQ